MKILSKLKRLFRTQYRLTVYYHGDSFPHNIYANNCHLLRNVARQLNNTTCWSLYKSGPFGLPEREINSGC